MSWFMGIDIGSAYSKGVIIRDGETIAHTVMLSGANYRQTAEKIRQELLSKLKLSADDITATVATGTGAGNVQFASQKVSDMICTARGINKVFPAARTAIDIAGQSSKVMRIDPQGMVTNFAVSEKCAAGSGRFIEVIANVLRIDLKDFGPLSLLSKNPVAFSTGCAVFGESEAVTRVAEGMPKEDIAAGVNKALADKISSLVKKVKLEEPCAICGGGAFNIGLVTMIEQELSINVLVPQQPQIIAALGAALTAQAANSIT
ncbi:MAG: 2-hydroxyglutaryl-CoA dehydratase [Chloroflexi bacterium]|nr:2-hydroxyglutaryl-CoA dehydratase [Chloroflexota bacterium]MBM3172319.1 2-hydroxyglutaryl-CoA dehydratase [Chloroflexota bacterium]MBM3174687.1 2-hydroxyglutaryl-CoA dehydratase [Chloroflexota bacterium]MBM4450097.1 2-hydroxyglutaryl-CoA dehydratase [Chloroflexota bacterium]